jgi:hypothetical protein
VWMAPLTLAVITMKGLIFQPCALNEIMQVCHTRLKSSSYFLKPVNLQVMGKVWNVSQKPQKNVMWRKNTPDTSSQASKVYVPHLHSPQWHWKYHDIDQHTNLSSFIQTRHVWWFCLNIVVDKSTTNFGSNCAACKLWSTHDLGRKP